MEGVACAYLGNICYKIPSEVSWSLCILLFEIRKSATLVEIIDSVCLIYHFVILVVFVSSIHFHTWDSVVFKLYCLCLYPR